MPKPSWREIHLDCLRLLYGRYFNKYNREGRNSDNLFFDDRGIFCNLYKQMEEALLSMEEEPLNYVKVALNRKLTEDCNTLKSIIRVFDYKNANHIPEWLKEDEII